MLLIVRWSNNVAINIVVQYLYILYTFVHFVYSLIHKLFLIICWERDSVEDMFEGSRRVTKSPVQKIESTTRQLHFLQTGIFFAIFLKDKANQNSGKLYCGYAHTILWATPVYWEKVFFISAIELRLMLVLRKTNLCICSVIYSKRY